MPYATSGKIPRKPPRRKPPCFRDWTPSTFDWYNMDDVRQSDLVPDKAFLEWWEENNECVSMDEGYQGAAVLMWPCMRFAPKDYGLAEFVILVNKMILKSSNDQ